MPELYDKTADSVMACTPALSRATQVKGAFLFVLFLLVYATPISLLVNEWGSPDFSHGAMVPFISIYFIWIERDRLKGVPVRPALASGLALIAASALILMIGRTGRIAIVEEASILIIIPGLVALLLGTGYLRILVLPLSYLAFMVPLLNPLIDKIHWPFQVFTAKFAAAILPYCGVPVYQRMQYLELPNITLEVAKGCSGVQFMVSIYAIAIPLAYFTQRGWLRKTILLALAFIIGVFTNGVRVTLIGIWTYFRLGNALHGPYHLLQGYFVAIVGFILLFMASLALSRISTGASHEVQKEVGLPPGEFFINRSSNASWLIAIAFLLGIGWYMYFVNPAPVPLKQPLNGLPFSVGDWKGMIVSGDRSPVRVPGARDELTRLYRKGSDREAILYIGYLGSQMDGGGLVNDYFNDYYAEIQEIEVPDIRGTIHLNKKIMRAGGREYIALFWYDLNGKALTNMRRVKLETAYNGLIHGRTNGALVMVMSEIRAHDNPKEVFHDESEMVLALQPLLRKIISPDRPE